MEPEFFTGKEPHDINLNIAAAWTKNYRMSNPDLLKGHYFGGLAISSIIKQDYCVGIRIYYAYDETGVQQLIITGVTPVKNDLYLGILAERSINCPPTCGVDNPLNSDIAAANSPTTAPEYFTGKEPHDITLETAAAWTKSYRDKNPNLLKGHYFGKDAIIAILEQEYCVGIRIYYAYDEAGVQQLIITGVTASKDDLYLGKLAERSINCPPTCGLDNPLNSDLLAA